MCPQEFKLLFGATPKDTVILLDDQPVEFIHNIKMLAGENQMMQTIEITFADLFAEEAAEAAAKSTSTEESVEESKETSEEQPLLKWKLLADKLREYVTFLEKVPGIVIKYVPVDKDWVVYNGQLVPAKLTEELPPPSAENYLSNVAVKTVKKSRKPRTKKSK